MRNWLLIFFLLFSSAVWSQEESDLRQLYMQAESEYSIGRFDASIRLLDSRISRFEGALRVSAYRLMSLCCLALDRRAEAEHYASLLLREDPYYTVTIHDPVRFADMIGRLKRGEEATITTASQQAESVEEAPVPVTLITEEMIKASGARTLADLLTLYVPGMTMVEGDESNVAMFGVYSSLQEKILIMQDGHRLNSRCTNSEAPDFRISLDKIKQIEVLRGPASSLYGNVALTAVVNIITKTGKETDGIQVSGGIGNNRTYKGDVVIGRRMLNMDFFCWLSVYSSQGERHRISRDDPDFWGVIPRDGYMYLGGYNKKPAYDIGFTFQWNRFRIMFSQQYSKKTPAYSSVGLTTTYDYEKYRTFNGAKPGSGRLSTRGEIQYAHRWKNLSFDASVYIDAEECSRYDIGEDTVPKEYGVVVPMEGEYIQDTIYFTRGYFQVLDWKDYNVGAVLKANYAYKTRGTSHGNLLLGSQIESYHMYDNSFLMGDKFERIVLTSSAENRMLANGNELNLSVFVQDKHYFNDQWIFNGGLRYDYKSRFNSKVIHAFSPRASLIFMPHDRLNVKLGYARSFVDAPFFYRANRTVAYSSGVDLKPEYMDAVQLSVNYAIPSIRLDYEGNVRYNKLTNIVVQDLVGSTPYMNAGFIKTAGIENSLSYSTSKTYLNFNMTYQYVIDSESKKVYDHQIANVPSLTFNLTASHKVWEHREHSLTVQGNCNFHSKQKSPIVPSIIFKDGQLYEDLDRTVNRRLLLNLGGRYQYKDIECSIQCHNLLDSDYTQGGEGVDVPQQGISFLAKLIYKFSIR